MIPKVGSSNLYQKCLLTSWIMDCNCSVVDVKVPGEILATWRTSQLVLEISTENQTESDQNFFWESGKIPDSQRKVRREISSQKNYFSKQLLERSTSFENRFPDSASFESRSESLTLLPPKLNNQKGGWGKQWRAWTLKKKNSIPLWHVNCLGHVCVALFY
jgi:hypothetical protein